jgi:hypothetical protein
VPPTCSRYPPCPIINAKRHTIVTKSIQVTSNDQSSFVGRCILGIFDFEPMRATKMTAAAKVEMMNQACVEVVRICAIPSFFSHKYKLRLLPGPAKATSRTKLLTSNARPSVRIFPAAMTISLPSQFDQSLLSRLTVGLDVIQHIVPGGVFSGFDNGSQGRPKRARPIPPRCDPVRHRLFMFGEALRHRLIVLSASTNVLEPTPQQSPR